MAKKFGYKKYLKPNKQKKDLSTLKVFICSFVLMLVVFTVLINCYAPEVDVSIGDATEETVEPENNIYLKKYVDDRLLAIQQEDQRADLDVSYGNDTEDIRKPENNMAEAPVEPKEVPEMKPIELVTSIPEIKISTPAEVLQAAPKPPVPPVVQTSPINATYRVYIGHYHTYDQVKIAKDIVNETDPELNAVIKEVSTGYTLQAGVFKSKEAATNLTNMLLKQHLPARMVIE